MIEAELSAARSNCRSAQHQAAIKAYEKVPPASMTADDFLCLGDSHAHRGGFKPWSKEGFSVRDWRKALDAYDAALKLQPRIFGARLGIARFHLASGKLTIGTRHTADPETAKQLIDIEETFGSTDPAIAMMRTRVVELQAQLQAEVVPPESPPEDRTPGTLAMLEDLFDTKAAAHPKQFFEMVPISQIVTNFRGYQGRYVYLDGCGLGSDNYEDLDIGFEDTVYCEDFGIYHLKFPFKLERGAWDLGDMAFIARVEELRTFVNNLGMTITIPVFRVVVAHDTKGIRKASNAGQMFKE